jgi:hypothetical protein
LAIERIARERTGGTRELASLKLADVEYRVVWNKAKTEWNVFRNGAATNIFARKKKKSAVDSAVRDAKAELENSRGVIVVTCVEGRKSKTVWRGP